MKILGKNLKNKDIGVEITNNEDLWFLSHIIEEKDLITGRTERKIKIGNDDNQKTVRKTVFLTIRTEKTEYEPENNSLRILGTITKGPDDIPLGEHHSFNISLRDKINIIKENWMSYQIEKIEEATKEKANTLLVVFDREDVKYALLKNSGYETLSEKKGDVQKKQEETTQKNNFYKEIALQIKEYFDRHKIQNIIIASPAFWKEYLLKELPDDLKKKTISATISGVDDSSFQELLKRDELKKVLENERTTKELNLIEELLGAISKDKAFYGIKEAKEKVAEGSALKFLVSETFIKKMKEENKYFEIDKLLKNAEAIRANITILSGKESSKKLDGLGGVAGTLRW